MKSIDEHKNDDHAFLFTLKNPYEVPPTRYMKKKKSTCAIICHSYNGPRFGYGDIYISYRCNKENKCTIRHKGTYECHPEYKSSLFVNIAGPDEDNDFTVLDYEVYTH